MEELEKKFKDLTFAGYYDDAHSFTVEILKEDLIQFLQDTFKIDNVKIV